MVRKALRNGIGLLVIVGIGLIFGARETASDSYLLWTQANRAPAITSTPPVMTSAAYQYDVEAADPDGDLLTFSLTNAPAGMTINAVSGLILWTATLAQIGTYAPSVTVSDGKGGAAAQTIPLTVFAAWFDEEPPWVTLMVTPDQILPNQSVTIMLTAEDDTGVAARSVIVNGSPLSLDANGIAIYTPTVPGTNQVIGSATDLAGKVETATRTFWVRGNSATVKFYEGFDAERGVSEQDPTVVTMTPGNLTTVTAIPYPPGVTQLFTFSERADVHFEYAPGATTEILMRLEPSVTAAFLPGIAYETVTAAMLPGLTFTTWPDGQAVAPGDTVVFRTIPGAYFKMGHFTVNAADWTVGCDYAELIPE